LQDSRFNPAVDGRTGYRTHCLVSMPVCNYDGEVIGVAQILNKKSKKSDDSENNENFEAFTEEDLKVRGGKILSKKSNDSFYADFFYELPYYVNFVSLYCVRILKIFSSVMASVMAVSSPAKKFP